jgi:hypothetical protein
MSMIKVHHFAALWVEIESLTAGLGQMAIPWCGIRPPRPRPAAK